MPFPENLVDYKERLLGPIYPTSMLKCHPLFNVNKCQFIKEYYISGLHPPSNILK
jgi:hypothetical protein